MRKVEGPTAPAPFVHLRDVLPALAPLLRAGLRKIGERDLADQIQELKIYGRCCDASPCGTFFCVPKDERRNLHSKGLAHSVGDFVVANGRIAEVTTCSSEVDTVLRQIFPEPEGLDHLHVG